MISSIFINHFPDQIGNGFNRSQYQEHFGEKTFIVAAESKEIEYSRHWGLLSIKCALNGTEFYQSGNATYGVRDGNYLIFNEGTYRSSYIRSDSPVRSFSISFSPADVNRILFSMLSSPEKLLDNPFHVGSERIHFTEKLFEHDEVVSPILFRVMELVQNWDFSKTEIDEQLTILLYAIAGNQQQVWRMMEQVQALKRSTQKELFERIHRAKDYISSCYNENLTIESISQVACLNSFYFLREFKKIMTLTPHQYLQKVRLNESLRLLRVTDKSIGEICNLIGFSDSASFCKLFKRTFNQTPSEFRVANR